MASPAQVQTIKPPTAISIAAANGIDITGGRKPAGSVDLRAITLAAEELRGIYSKLDIMDKEYQRLGDRVTELETSVLPDRMLEAGMASFTLSTGEQVLVADVVRGSIPTISSIENEKDSMLREEKRERRNRCFAWLKEVNADNLIKTEVAASFDKGEMKKAVALANYIEKKGIPVLLEQAVHPGTLNKFLKECIGQGREVPTEPFGLFTGKTAKIVAPKGKK